MSAGAVRARLERGGNQPPLFLTRYGRRHCETSVLSARSDRGKLAARGLDVAPPIQTDRGRDAGALEYILESRDPLARRGLIPGHRADRGKSEGDPDHLEDSRVEQPRQRAGLLVPVVQ